MSIILIIICLIVLTLMVGAIIKFHKLVDDTKAKADAMSEEEKMSYRPFAQDNHNENMDNTSID